MNKQNDMQSRPDALIVAVTGGIGCGQSTVAKFLEKQGAKIIDADAIGHAVVNSDESVRREIRRQLGNQYFFQNGRLNRRLLGQAVFEDERKLYKLNQIVHPRMVSRIIEKIETAKNSGRGPVIVIDAALVYEINIENIFDAVVVVSSRMRERIARVKKRDRLTEKEIRDRISKQIPVQEKARWADYVIYNNSTLERLEERSKQIYRELLKKTKKMKINAKV